jgi:hypothetical protein
MLGIDTRMNFITAMHTLPLTDTHMPSLAPATGCICSSIVTGMIDR